MTDRKISIHSPLAGRDLAESLQESIATGISIHSPLAGRDIYFFHLLSPLPYFNPLAPRGARPLYVR